MVVTLLPEEDPSGQQDIFIEGCRDFPSIMRSSRHFIYSGRYVYLLTR
jgi:hypothetical protein